MKCKGKSILYFIIRQITRTEDIPVHQCTSGFCSYSGHAKKLTHSIAGTETEDLYTLPVWRDYGLANLEMLLL